MILFQIPSDSRLSLTGRNSDGTFGFKNLMGICWNLSSILHQFYYQFFGWFLHWKQLETWMYRNKLKTYWQFCQILNLKKKTYCRSICNDRRICKLEAKNSVFDPDNSLCSDVFKYLNVEYSCRRKHTIYRHYSKHLSAVQGKSFKMKI